MGFPVRTKEVTRTMSSTSSASSCKPADSKVCSIVSTFMVTPLTSVVYMGRGRRVSTKPNIITRNDLLMAAKEAELNASSLCSSTSSERSRIR